jgi:hypothetical protein
MSGTPNSHTHSHCRLSPGPFRNRPEASYVVAVRNPATDASPGTGLPAREGPRPPPELMDRFDRSRLVRQLSLDVCNRGAHRKREVPQHDGVVATMGSGGIVTSSFGPVKHCGVRGLGFPPAVHVWNRVSTVMGQLLSPEGIVGERPTAQPLAASIGVNGTPGLAKPTSAPPLQ